MENHQCALGIETKAISLRMKVKTIRGGSSDWKRRLLSSSTIPGFGKAQDATYQVTGSEFLVSSDGNKIDCWVMEHKFEVPAGGSGNQRLWISKRTHEVLKEEDQQPSGHRYKLKIGISGES